MSDREYVQRLETEVSRLQAENQDLRRRLGEPHPEPRRRTAWGGDAGRTAKVVYQEASR